MVFWRMITKQPPYQFVSDKDGYLLPLYVNCMRFCLGWRGRVMFILLENYPKRSVHVQHCLVK